VNRAILAAVSCLALAGFSAPKADAQMLLTGGFNPDFNFATNWVTGTIGAQITVGAIDLSVTSLGFGDFGQNGFVVGHTVGIWSSDVGNPLLGSVTLSAGVHPLVGEWAFATLGAPVILSANTSYYIGASTSTDDGDPWFGSDLPGIQPDFVYSSDFTGVPVGGRRIDGTFGAPIDGLGVQVYSLNLEYTAVPEPAFVALLMGSATLLLAVRRARRSQNPA